MGLGLVVLVSAGAAVAFRGDDEEPVVDDPVAPVGTYPVTTPAPGPVGQSVVGGAVSGASASGHRAPLSVPSPNLPVDLGNQQMVRSTEIRLSVPPNRFSEVFDRVATAATEHGGFVVSSVSGSTAADEPRSGQLVLRVPVSKFEMARQAIGQLGEVESQSIRGADVSAELVDQEARLRSLQVQEETLRGLVGKATTVGEVLQVQPTLFAVRQQIEQLQAQQANLEQAAELATIVVSLHEEGGRSPAASENELSRRVEQALDGAVSVVGGMIVVVGWASPVVALAVVGWLATRLRRRRLAPLASR
jgi:hypothetical protein